ncbi:MAG: ASCH domain-containing protein [Candidatus Omnitrophica bacterium]|nr:ASCH domain-containing protein [Candidatus Omnitrophota bacterium]
MKVPVLAVKQPWAGLIAAGLKTWEIRNFSAPEKYVGQKIAIYASRTNPKADDLKHVSLRRFMFDYHVQDPTSLPSPCFKFGEIIATAILETYQRCENSLEFSYQEPKHWAPLSYHIDGKTHFWGLADIQALKPPIPFKFPRGSVVWTSADLETI